MYYFLKIKPFYKILLLQLYSVLLVCMIAFFLLSSEDNIICTSCSFPTRFA